LSHVITDSIVTKVSVYFNGNIFDQGAYYVKEVMIMKRCKSCSVPIAFGAGLIVASILPTKAVCVIAAIVLIVTCIARRC